MKMRDRIRNLLWILAALALAAGCATFQRYGAPKFRAEGPHAEAGAMKPEDCFACHREGKDGAPKAPESMYGRENCSWCHLRG